MDPSSFLSAIGGFSGGAGPLNFLNSIFEPLGSSLGNSLNQAIFGRQDRISNRDFQFYQDLIDSTIPREISRHNDLTYGTAPADMWRMDYGMRTAGQANIDVTNQFLRDVTPNQANAYNTMQDMTYGEDTARMQGRMDTLYAGTSPWERLGVAPSGPVNVPLPSNPGGGAPAGPTPQTAGSFLPSIAGQAVQANTQLKTAEIAAQTARDVAKINQDTQFGVTSTTTAGGELPKTQVKAAAQGISESVAREGLAYTQANVANNRALLDNFATVLSFLPKGEINVPGLKIQYTDGWRGMLDVLSKENRVGQLGSPSETLGKYIGSLPKDEFDVVMKNMEQLAGAIHKQMSEAAGGIGKFLGLVK